MTIFAIKNVQCAASNYAQILILPGICECIVVKNLILVQLVDKNLRNGIFLSKYYIQSIHLVHDLFFFRYNMMTHFKAHQGIHRVSSKSYMCPICNLGFPKPSKLNEHLAAQHNTCTSANSSSQSKLEHMELPRSDNISLSLCTDSVNELEEENPGIDTHNAEIIRQINANISSNASRSMERTINIPSSHFLIPFSGEMMEIKKEESLLFN